MLWPPSDARDLGGLLDAAKLLWPFITGGILETHSRENVVCRVATAQGDCALRLHRPGLRSAGELASELQFMAAMDRAGLAVPKPMPTAAGGFVAMLDGIQADMLSWLPGLPLGKSRIPLDMNDDEVTTTYQRIGRAVAELHVAASKWQHPESFQRPVLDLEGLLGDNPVWGRFWQLSGVDTSTLSLLASARTALHRQLSRLAPEMSYGLIHADVVRENVLRDGERISFIDFDDSGTGFRIYDLATCLVKSRFEPRYEMMQAAMLQGYQLARPLSPAELQALPLFIAVRALSLVGWMEQRITDPGARERRDVFLQEAMTELRGLQLA